MARPAGRIGGTDSAYSGGSIHRYLIIAALAAASVTPAIAEPDATAVPAPAGSITITRVETPMTGSATLPPNADIMLRLDEELNSKTARVGQSFRLTSRRT